ncbi:MAG: tellurite resistance TerB family protein [Gammaproteobacteria bacterium]|nr:tellurite resistance TerB family protein [Gammaproteobacteria bacterium]
MDARDILDNLLQTGKELVEQGKDLAEDKIGVPVDKSSRKTMLEGAKKGAIGAGLLALLVGTGAGRAVGGAALKMGSLAAVGGLAYKAFQNWQSVHAGKPVSEAASADQLDGEAAQNRSVALLRAMIAAAKADGHIDESEIKKIKKQLGKLELDGDTLQFLQTELTKPVNAADIAAAADSPNAAAEIYLVSRIIINETNAQEKAYLAELAKQLGLKSTLVAELDYKATQNLASA